MKKKKAGLFIAALAIIVLAGCNNDNDSTNESSTTTAPSSSTTEQTSSSYIPTEEKLFKEQFDALPQETKMLLITNTVDSRIKDYPGLAGLMLSYFVDGNTVYTQITSGVGSGHPIYQLSLEDAGVTPVRGVTYVGSNGYEEVAVDNRLVTNEMLLQSYEEDKANFDNAAQNVQESTNLKEQFDELSGYVSGTSQQADGYSNIMQPTDDEMLAYFTQYVLADTGITDDSVKEETHYGVDENGGQMIRYGGGQGAYATIEGTRIIYSGYNFGGVNDDGTVEKSALYTAYYDLITGEHGLL